MGNYTINVFTMVGCGHCQVMKDFLKNKNLPYKEFPIAEHKDTFKQIVELTGHNALPTLYLQDSESGEGPIFIPGRDYTNEEELIAKIEKYIPIEKTKED